MKQFQRERVVGMLIVILVARVVPMSDYTFPNCYRNDDYEKVGREYDVDQYSLNFHI